MHRNFLLIFLLITSGISLPLRAQNIVKNGGFEGATIAPWNVSGLGINPALEKFNVTGTSTSKCFAVTPSGGTPASGHRIEQVINLAKGVTYEVRIDVAALWRGSISGSPILDVSTTATGTHRFWATSNNPNPQRVQLVGRVGPTKSNISTTFTILLMALQYSPRPNWGFRFYIDNVDVRPTREPRIDAWKPFRLLGQKSSLKIEGKPGVPYLLFASTVKASPRIKFAGITGDLGIGPTPLIIFLSGIFDTSGRGGVSNLMFPNIKSLSGLAIHWQAFQFNSILNVADLGWEVTQGFR